MFAIRQSTRKSSYLIPRAVFIRQQSSKDTSAIINNDQKKPKKRSSKSYNYCIGHVKKYDHENYIAATWIQDPAIKRAVFALRAFNIELAQVRDLTTNLERAQIRFQFWSKLVEAIIERNLDSGGQNEDKFKAYRRHSPVCRELLDLFEFVEIDPLMQEYLNDLIKSRMTSEVLGYKLFATLQDLEANCSKSNGSLYHLACNISLQFHGETDTVKYPEIREAANNLGIAHGLSNIIRGMQHSARKDCCYVPYDLLKESNLHGKQFTGKSFDPKIVSPVVERLSNRCENLIEKVNAIQNTLPETVRHILLPRIAIQTYLGRLRKSDYNLSDARLRSPNGLLPLKLWLASKFKFN